MYATLKIAYNPKGVGRLFILLLTRRTLRPLWQKKRNMIDSCVHEYSYRLCSL